jgi:hypothetical protein
MSDDERHIAVSLDMLSGVAPGTTAEEIDEMLDIGKIMYDRMRVRLQEKVAAERRGYTS